MTSLTRSVEIEGDKLLVDVWRVRAGDQSQGRVAEVRGGAENAELAEGLPHLRVDEAQHNAAYRHDPTELDVDVPIGEIVAVVLDIAALVPGRAVVLDLAHPASLTVVAVH